MSWILSYELGRRVYAIRDALSPRPQQIYCSQRENRVKTIESNFLGAVRAALRAGVCRRALDRNDRSFFSISYITINVMAHPLQKITTLARRMGRPPACLRGPFESTLTSSRYTQLVQTSIAFRISADGD